MTTTSIAPTTASTAASTTTLITSNPSNRQRLAGRILSGIVILLLAFDSGMKLIQAPAVVEGTVKAGFAAHHVLTIGIILAVCLVLYIIPRTAPLGAVLLTGYLGGAVATNLRLDMPLFSFLLAPVYVGIVVWGGLYLRDARVRAAIGPAR